MPLRSYLATARLALLCVTVTATAACGAKSTSGVKEAWNQSNDPLHFGSDYERRFSRLPERGELATKPWVDTYWPNPKGGIATRWYTGTGFGWENGFDYTPPTESQVRQMSPAQLSHLSPAEKYDILQNRFDYPLLRDVRSRNAPTSPHWWGICHGWSEASLLFNEPKAVNFVGNNGIDIPFGSSDLKALLGYYQAIDAAPRHYVGVRCNEDLSRHPERANNPECRDVNAGAFHIIITNFLGLRQQGLIADITRDLESWNQPLSSYSSRVVRTQGPSSGAASGTASEVVVETTMRYSQEVEPQWEPLNGTDKFSTGSARYSYRLELDSRGNIIGGEWLSQERPDLLWLPSQRPFTDYYAVLGFLESHNGSSGQPASRGTLHPTLAGSRSGSSSGSGSRDSFRGGDGKSYPYCVRSGDTGGGYGWEPELGGPNGGSCKMR